MRVAVLDLGKSNAKLALVETDDATERRVETLPTPTGTSPYPHIDAEAIAAFAERSLAAFTRAGGVDAVTVTTHGATGALLDADGGLALPVLDYEHGGVDETRATYEALRPPFAETGSPALPGGLNLGAQLHWQQRRFPERFARATTLLTWPQYWVHRLCGARANDVTSLGCHTDLFAPARGAPSSLPERAGWGALLPPLCRSGERLGNLEPALAARTGLAATTPVHAGIHDSNASLVPHLIGREGPVTVVSSGTWIVAMALGGRPVALDERRDTLLNVDAFGAAVPSARFMGGRERELLLAEAAGAARRPPGTAEGERGAAALARVAERGVLPTPTFASGTGPWPDVVGRWSGDPDTLSPPEREAAVALYLAFVTAECVALIGGVAPLVVEGPLASDEFYLLALAALFAADEAGAGGATAVRAGDSRTGTAVGAAMLLRPPRAPRRPRGVRAPAELVPAVARARTLWRARLSSH